MNDANVGFLDETIEVWQPRASRRLTREDARLIVESVSGSFGILLEWDSAERRAPARRVVEQPAVAVAEGGRE